MKRIAILLLLLLLASGCSSMQNVTGRLDRETILPDDYVGRIVGAPMRQVYDIRDESTGILRWAWEETDGTPKLLVVEICFPPEDCDGLYNTAQSGSANEVLAAPAEAAACYDGRAAHIRFGDYYIRAAVLGVQEEKNALGLIATRLVSKLHIKK